MVQRWLVAVVAGLAAAWGGPCFAVLTSPDLRVIIPGFSVLQSQSHRSIQVVGTLTVAMEDARQLLETGRYGDAEKRAREAIAGAANDAQAAPAHELLGIALYLEGNTTGAVDELKRAIQLSPQQSSAITRLGSIAWAADDVAGAKGWFEQALQVTPTDAVARQRLANVLLRQGDTAGAIAAYQQAIGDMPPKEQLAARLDLANIYERQHRYAEVAQVLAPVVDDTATNRDALLALGIADVETGATEAGLRLLQRAQRLEPNELRPALALGIAQRKSGKLEDSVATLKQAAALQPATADAYFQLGLSYVALSRYDEAQKALEQAKTISPNAGAIEQGIGETLLLGGKPAQAIALFRAMASRSTARLADFVALATACQLAGDLPAAETAYRDAVARFPKDANAHWRLGAMLALERRYADAGKAFAKARELSPDDPRLLRDISLVLFREGRTAEAIATAQRIVALDPKSADARFHLAGLYQDSGDVARATDLYRAILLDDPNYVYALNNLAAVLTDRGSANEAVPMARRAASLMPDNPVLTDTLGWALLKAGNTAEAVETLQRAAKLAPTNPETLYRLAVARKQAGDAAAARSVAAQALAISTDFKDAAAAKLLAQEPPG